MPLRVQLEPQSQCSYFSICSLDDVTVGENGVTQQLIDVWVDASTLSRHNQSTTTSLSHAFSDPSQVATLLRPEQHFYPSSLAFDLICLLDQGFVHASHLGLQRKVSIYFKPTLNKQLFCIPRKDTYIGWPKSGCSSRSKTGLT